MNAEPELFDRGFLEAQWSRPPGVRALTTLRRGAGIGSSAPPFDQLNLGSRCGDQVDTVIANRLSLQSTLNLAHSPRWLRQTHGNRVVRFSNCQARTEADPEPEADAAVTSERGIALAILTADCLPVLFSALNGSEVGAAHAGWRGLAEGVLENTIAAMQTAPDQLQVWIGPAAGAAMYEVGEEVRSAFVPANGSRAAEAFVATRPGHWLCDLPALVALRLRATGVSNISGGGYCTIGDTERFFSHRRDGVSGRMATLIWREST